jgi:type I restriction enzyme R subunit
MTTFQTNEKHVSQIPAITALMQFGYQYLSQAEALKMRGSLRWVLLEEVLIQQILKLNKFIYRGVEYQFSAGDAEEAVRKLKPPTMEHRALVRTNQGIYDHLLLGTTIEKTIDDDRKSYSVKYIDWDNPSNNVYHVTAEFAVERTESNSTRRCDIVLFVNGIPFAVIENKAPSESAQLGITQIIRYQAHGDIPELFHYVQLMIATNKNEAFYGTVGTQKPYWQPWKDEEDNDADIHNQINEPLKEDEKSKLFTGDFANARRWFEAQSDEGARAVTQQDQTLYALCRPERLLEMVRIFSVFDG